ncbi:MAG: cardiolipin synthase ClsB [Elusimicrobia bacterium]|nr:cardiolipin synthase ClsB [Elusimicrobiota bacterium]
MASWRALFRRKPAPHQESYCDAPDEYTPGNKCELLVDGRQAYPAMLEAVSKAKFTIHLESYILRSDKTGWKFAKLMAERAKTSVQVRVIFDAVGSLDLSADYVQYLRNAGVQFLEYHPVAPWRPRWAWGRRDHRKILVVDGKVGFTGGLNIADDYADPKDGGGGWRDTAVRIEGPAAYELDHLFRATWYRETGRWFGLPGHPEHGAGQSLVRVSANQEFLHRHRIRRAYLHALRRARDRVCIANAYYVPDRMTRRALYSAARRGVNVRILVQGETDVPAVAWAGRRLFEEHLRHGVKVYIWPGPVLHAKTVAIDGVWSSVGSYNMDHLSWLRNLEVNIHALDEKFAREMEDQFERDIAHCQPIELAAWRQRPLQEKLLERAFYMLRYWL